QAIERHFGFIFTFETRLTDVYVIKEAGSPGPESARGPGFFAVSGEFRTFDGPPRPESLEKLQESGVLLGSILRAGRELVDSGSSGQDEAYVRRTGELPESLLDQLRERFGFVITPGVRTGLI